MRKFVAIVAVILAVFVFSCRTEAAESSLDVVLYDAVVGGGIGALAGAATLAFMNHPGDHLERIYQGASIGTLCGIAFGVYEIRPILYTRVDHSGNRDKVYGLVVTMPIK